MNCGMRDTETTIISHAQSTMSHHFYHDSKRHKHTESFLEQQNNNKNVKTKRDRMHPLGPLPHGRMSTREIRADASHQ